MSDRQRHGLILLLVAGLVAASVVAIVSMKTYLGLDLKGGVELVYQGEPTPQSQVTAAALQRAVDVMENRVNQLGVSQPTIQTQGKNEIVVQLPNVQNVAQAENEVGNTARLEFYDWETNALYVPSGSKKAQSVATGLVGGDTGALTISQGSTATGPGGSSSASGAMGLYNAVELASKQPPYINKTANSRLGNEYFAFGAPGSAACAALAAANNTKAAKGVHCLLSGPYEPDTANASQATAIEGLETGLTPTERAGAQVLTVPQGITVLQAVPNSFAAGKWPKFGTSTAGYYVLRDNVALFGKDVTNPTEASDSTGAPDVQFGFDSVGASAFQKVTAQIAQRGQSVSLGANVYQQHFAVALDNQLLTVPYIDFKTYPDGIDGSQGADISGNFTITAATNLASELRLGALPIQLKQISEEQVSATLGQQALHQGLIAGLIGLIVVAVLLLVYYRMLGLIAVAGLLVYGIYFFALIKLIPITLSLAGIAGLILTIGVAADANIVIFERVKEEIRDGRTVRQGISIGYRKGLTAIIDANVVTIMTAFILFVLATADVKGFAFTLGIGTFVSLFTAVMATQAILMTLGSSRTIQSPSMLGAAGKRRRWGFDFMGASKYFFSMSGLILLIGALAIGGRGLNLGIDFTSGSQISVGLTKPATTSEIKSVMSSVGQGNATIQAVANDKTLGKYGFQIQSKYMDKTEVSDLRTDLQSKYGIRTTSDGNQDFDTNIVGPTFGSTVANSAVLAIIASLIVISLYVALRFDWKFAVPVLIALAHDLLITAGVYALTGRVVTTDTVAALLTILGYSMYDTIIVFDRIRENIPRMPRAAFSQVVNRSMSEVLTRSLATTSVTLIPIIALLILGGSTLKDFAFALLVGVASGAYSSIFIASPVLTHWKEREHAYRLRRDRITAELGYVPAYAAGTGADVEPERKQVRRTGRLTTPDNPDGVSSAEFEQMKRELGLEEERQQGSRRTSALAERTAHTPDAPAPRPPSPRRARSGQQPARGGQQPARGAQPPAPQPPSPTAPAQQQPPAQQTDEPTPDGEHFEHAPDVAEDGGISPIQKPKTGGAKSRSRNRRHGRR
jgi:SecD/SecF fusion protein